MEKTQQLVSVFYKILKNKNNTLSVSQIYGEMYNTTMFKDFILKIGVSSYDIVIATYALYYMLKESDLSILGAITKAVYNVFLVTSVVIEDKEPLTDDCGECGGDGTIPCTICDAEGQIECEECDGEGKNDEGDKCYECNGLGYTTCYECGGEEFEECTVCDGGGQVDDDEYQVTYNQEYYVVSNTEVVNQFKMRDENSYFNTDDFEELLDDDTSTNLYLGYVRDSNSLPDFITNYELDVDDVEYRDNFFLKIEEVYPSIVLKRLVGQGKFGRMI